MVELANYQAFTGHEWHWGAIRNALDYQGVKMPHTGKAPTEALLMGINGGVCFGYFFFAYDGYPPQVNILSYNTFNDFETLLDRLGIARTIRQTAKDSQAVKNLVEVLENGEVPIVWAEMFTLPYNNLAKDENWWGVMPLVVYGYDEAADCVLIADRAHVPLQIRPSELAAARARIKKDKFRIMTLEAPQLDKLQAAVTTGIWDCIKLFSEKPPKGSANNFGFKAYEHWAKMLTKDNQKQSWAKLMPSHTELLAGLISAYEFAALFAKDSSQTTNRVLYADFLEEAALILNKPSLKAAANLFRQSGAAWQELNHRFLPDSVLALAAIRQALHQEHELFLTQGQGAQTEIKQLKAQVAELKQQLQADFPLDAAGIHALKTSIAAQLLVIRDIEQQAISALSQAMA